MNFWEAITSWKDMWLFITRTYPPAIGGMQKLSYQLTTGIASQEKSQIIYWPGPRIGLIYFYVLAFIRTICAFRHSTVTLIHLSDPVLAPLGLILRFIKPLPVIVNAHGLDITYSNPLYQWIIPACLRSFDRIICISQYVRRECIRRGIPESRCVVIPPGVNVDEYTVFLSDVERKTWLSYWGIPYNQKILLSVGRLIPRKGIAHFISQALPLLMDRRRDWVYLIAGDGPERQKIEAAVFACGLSQQVKLLGKVDEHILRVAYALADVFVMPNIPLPGNPEGFGIVALEARASGVPVVASDLEGISEAVGGKEDGTLVEPGNWMAFVDAIEWWLNRRETVVDREKRRERVKTEFDWRVIIPKYLELFREIEKRYHSQGKIQDADSN